MTQHGSSGSGSGSSSSGCSSRREFKDRTSERSTINEKLMV